MNMLDSGLPKSMESYMFELSMAPLCLVQPFIFRETLCQEVAGVYEPQ